MVYLVLISLIPSLLLVIGLASALWAVHDRGRRARRQLAQESHQRALDLARRCDVIESRQRRLQRLQSVDHLAFLVSLGHREGRWQEATAGDLQRYVAGLYEEAEREVAS